MKCQNWEFGKLENKKIRGNKKIRNLFNFEIGYFKNFEIQNLSNLKIIKCQNLEIRKLENSKTVKRKI